MLVTHRQVRLPGRENSWQDSLQASLGAAETTP